MFIFRFEYLISGLKTGVENYIFWSETGSGSGEPGGTPPPRITRSTPRDSGHQIVFETPEGVLTKARVPSKICNYGNHG